MNQIFFETHGIETFNNHTKNLITTIRKQSLRFDFDIQEKDHRKFNSGNLISKNKKNINRVFLSLFNSSKYKLSKIKAIKNLEFFL